MLACVANRRSQSSGLRPFNPLFDISPMVELMEVSFGEALDPQSRQMLGEMRALARVGGPLLWVLSRLSPSLRELFSGYVWLEEGRIVGNVTVHRRYRGKTGWFISNLAVHPHHRRHGIAQRLMMQGMELARRRGADRVSLEVRAGNLAAQELYKRLGFTKVDSVSKMRLDRVRGVSPVRSREYEIEPANPKEWRKLYQLAKDAVSPEAREIAPVKETDYRANLAQRVAASIGDLLRGQKLLRWVARRDDRFVALVTLRTGGLLACHSLVMMVHHDHRGNVEETLLTRALSTIERYASRPVSATIRPSYGEVLEIFRRYGFVEEQTLDLLTLHFQ